MISSNTFPQHLGSVVSCRLRLFRALVFIFLFVFAALCHGQTLGQDTPSGFFPGTISIFAGTGTLPPDGNPATSSLFSEAVQAVAVDSQGNVYIGDHSGVIYVIYGGSQNIPEILAEVTTKATPAVTPVKGDIYQVANLNSQCGVNAPPDCGEGQPASQAEFNDITNLFIDGSDNLYVTDSGASVVRLIDHATAVVTTVAGQLNNPGTPLTGGTPATTSATLSFPNDAKVDAAGNIYIADSGNGIISVVYLHDPVPPILTQENVSPLTKGNIYPVAGMPLNFCFGQDTCGDNGPALNATFAYPLSVDIDQSGNIYIADSGSNFATPVIGGTIRMVYVGGKPVPPLLKIATENPVAGDIYAIAGTESAACVVAACGDGGPALQAQLNSPAYVRVDSSGNGDIYIDDELDNTIRKVDAAGYISTIAGTETPNAPATSPTGNGGPATIAGFNNPNSFAFDTWDNLYIADQYDLVVWQVLPAVPQTITFNPLAPVTYGTAPITLTATASSGLPVSYSVTGPARISGSNLVITGAGTVQITASQPGNSQYAAAPAVTQSLTVDKALLTVQANDESAVYQQPIPPFTASYIGFVNGDTQQTAFTGQPAFSTSPPVTIGSHKGTYTIIVSQGTLASTNYNFAFVNGTLTITGSTPQTITFNPLTPVTYGQVSTINLSATTSSNLPVQFSWVSGPSSISGSVLTIKGGGTIVIEATQAGNNTYAAASATQQLTVNPAPLTVTAPNVSLPYATTVNPVQFPQPTITGFVGSDTQAVVTGSPQYTTASGTPEPGSYPIQVSQGTLALVPGYTSNYAFANFVSGTLTITTAPQSINFTPLPALTTYGNTVTLAATASSGLPVTFSATGSATFFAGVNATNPGAGVNTVTLNLTGAGVVTVIATQSGSAVYAAATPVTQTFTVLPAVLTISAVSLTRTYDVPNPTLTYQINGFVNGDGDVPSIITGIPALSTTANQQSAPGSYPITITQGTLAAPNYTFNLVNGTLTVLPAGDYTLAASPSTLTIQSGHAAQTTITVTPNNDYQGTIALSCGSVPSNVSCIFSPATYTFGGNANGGTENPLHGTLTITTMGGQTVVGALSQPAAPSGAPLLAFLVPAGMTGLLITGRRRKSTGARIWYLATFVALSLEVLTLTSCGSSNAPALAAPGTTTITVNGMDGQSLSSSTSLTVTIQ